MKKFAKICFLVILIFNTFLSLFVLFRNIKIFSIVIKAYTFNDFINQQWFLLVVSLLCILSMIISVVVFIFVLRKTNFINSIRYSYEEYKERKNKEKEETEKLKLQEQMKEIQEKLDKLEKGE
jgi:uncharacterized protein YlxW (UPF0749 family)